MKLVRFFKSKTFWLNFILAAILVSLTFYGFNKWLDSYTLHGENIEVPDLNRLSYEEATAKLEEMGLRAEILDTAEFNPKFPRGGVVDQYPPAKALVKSNREVKLTLNPMRARKIELPELVEKTKRRAIYDLESKGFEVGDFEYVPFIGKDVVVNVKVNGKKVEARDRFDKGTVVTLVLGRGLSETRIAMPYLKYKNLASALEVLKEFGLNLGQLTYDMDLQDSSAAVVYQQYPPPSLESNVSQGTSVDLWLTDDYTKIVNDSLAFQRGEVEPLDSEDEDPEFE